MVLTSRPLFWQVALMQKAFFDIRGSVNRQHAKIEGCLGKMELEWGTFTMLVAVLTPSGTSPLMWGLFP